MTGFVGALREAPLQGLCLGARAVTRPIPWESAEAR